MSTISWHKNKSIHNQDVSDYLNIKQPTYHDWEIISVFYSALHLVDAYILKITSKRPADHSERNRKVKTNISTIFPQYHRLYMMSRTARYDSDMTKVQRDYALQLHSIIKSYLDSKI